jgi:uncharacterized protein YunC (DUF1805 family)
MMLHQLFTIRNIMQQTDIHLTKKTAKGYVIPFGPVNLVMVLTDTGMVGCGMFDVAALDSFSFPAAKVRAATGGIVTIDDLMKATVKEVNRSAIGRGITTGMTGRQALELL